METRRDQVHLGVQYPCICCNGMRIGGGSRLKLLEALAMEAPVVSSSMGVADIAGLRDGEHLLIADDPQAFVKATLRLMADPELGRELGTAGRAHVAAHYDWSVIIPLLEEVYAPRPVH